MSGMTDPRAGDLLPGGGILTERYAMGGEWQIWLTKNGSALCVSPALCEDWIGRGFTEPGLFLPAEGGYMAAETEGLTRFSSASHGPYPRTGLQAMEIARAFFRARRSLGPVPLSRALFLPCLPHLLPLGDGDDSEGDPLTLGRWLSGGMNVPFTDRARMLEWTPGLTESAWREIMDLFGWRETAPQRIREAEPREEIPANVLPRREDRRREGPFCLPGRPALERFFREQIIDVIDREEAYRRMGILFPGPTLLVGPPGCGKTHAVEQLVEYLGWPCFTVNSETIASSYIHETARLIARLFREAADNAPSVVVIDEMEAYLSTRSGPLGGQGHHVEEVAEFLRLLPELPKQKVLLFGMTNMPERIDPSITRKGRFDHILKVEMPSEEELCALLESLLENVPTERDLDLRKAAARLRSRPISDAVFVAREAGRLAVVRGRDRIDGGLLLLACDELDQQGSEGSPRRSIGFR